MDKWIAITGCNGYIGGQTVLRFKDAGYKVVGVDRNNTAPWISEKVDLFISGDFTNPVFLNCVVGNSAEALVHIAGTSLVGPSMKDPAPYYLNNVGSTARLLGSLAQMGWTKTVIFSGSAAVYGNPIGNISLTEESPKLPISPYGQSKLMAEQVLRDCATGYGFKTISFRYFNACGGDSLARHGQLKKATHLIARIMESIVTKDVFTLNGDDYSTPDGTCVRDYLHVEDIAEAHYLATLFAQTMSTTSVEFNLGSGRGISIREIIASVEKITGKTVLTHTGPRREGDPAVLVASSLAVKNSMGWIPEKSDLDNIVRTAWNWYNSVEYTGRA
jgi:UDP-glucose 4-epimerase